MTFKRELKSAIKSIDEKDRFFADRKDVLSFIQRNAKNSFPGGTLSDGDSHHLVSAWMEPGWDEVDRMNLVSMFSMSEFFENKSNAEQYKNEVLKFTEKKPMRCSVTIQEYIEEIGYPVYTECVRHASSRTDKTDKDIIQSTVKDMQRNAKKISSFL